MLTKRTGYAILALACMSDEQNKWVLVKDIVARTAAPQPYLHKILHALGKSGIIRTKRGYRGGMGLSRPANQITLWDVAEATEGLEWKNRCLLGLAECDDQRACPTHEFWSVKKEKIAQILKEVTLADVAEFESKQGGRLRSLEGLTGQGERPWR